MRNTLALFALYAIAATVTAPSAVAAQVPQSPPAAPAQPATPPGTAGQGATTPVLPAPPPLPGGDPVRGEALFASSGCFTCHRIGDRGSRLGPDLTTIGSLRTPDRLRLALVAPDEEVIGENRSVRVVTKDGTTVTGRLLNQDALSIQMMNPNEELKTYLKKDLREYAILDKGLMPSTQGTLTDQQVADVVNYLYSLKIVTEVR